MARPPGLWARMVRHRADYLYVAPAILVMPYWSHTARTAGKRAGFLRASLLFLDRKSVV
mgnify:CR=1 FL=1